jgi:hypothetical protein
VNRCTPGEIESSHLIDPSCRVPRPAGNRVINHRGPDEHKDYARQHPTSLGHRTNGQCHTSRETDQSTHITSSIRSSPRRNLRDCSKHALVNGKHEVWDLTASHRRCGEDISEPKILQVPDKPPGGMREGEGVTPEKPLK